MENNRSTKLGLTKSQLKCFDVIKNFIEKNRYSPSVREVAELMNMTGVSNVHRLIKELERRGWIRSSPKMRRSIQII